MKKHFGISKQRDILIANFLNLPLDKARLGKPSAIDASSLVDKILQDAHVFNDNTPAKILMRSWGDIMGENAKLVSPIKISAFTLYAKAANHMLAANLAFEERSFLEKIKKIKGLEKIKKIRFL